MRRIESCDMSKPGSWLPFAEDDFGAMQGQGLRGLRNCSLESARTDIAAWPADRKTGEPGLA